MSSRASKISGLPAPTPEQSRESRKLLDSSVAQLGAVRTTAENWRNAGLVGSGIALGGAVLAGPATIAALGQESRAVTLILLASGLFIAILAITFSIRASIGWPRWLQASDPLARKKWEWGETRLVVALLKWSMALTVISVALVASAIGVALTTYPAADGSGAVLVVDRSGSAYCANAIERAGNELRIETDSLTTTVPWRDVISIKTVAAC